MNLHATVWSKNLFGSGLQTVPDGNALQTLIDRDFASLLRGVVFIREAALLGF